MIHVAVVDDHPLVREGIRSACERAEGVTVVGVFPDGRDFLRAARNLARVDVVLLDISMPESDGLDVLERLLSWRVPPRVLMLSMHPERSHAKLAMDRGAHGYLTKDVDETVLLEAVRTVAFGGTYLSPDAHALVHGVARADPVRGVAGLSEQERRVFRLLKLGLTVKEISRDLDINPSTVATYKARLMAKLGVRSLAALLRFNG